MPKFEKNVIPHQKFYIAAFANKKNKNAPYLLFIHGGPGLNCGVVEFLIEHEDAFEGLDCNIILYDQRACGRSVKFFEAADAVTHNDNVNDLQEIYQYLTSIVSLTIKGFIGHSYGAKLLFDFYKTNKSDLPGIFISTADSILTPRLNNLMFDLSYLKKKDPEKYKEATRKLDLVDLKVIWELTEELAPYFQENKDRSYLYWANIDVFEKVQEIQKNINLPMNQKVFMSVRKNLYSNKNNCDVNVDTLDQPYLWINGFQDSIIGEPANGLAKSDKLTLFAKSSHYPHLEENNKFCEIVNAFTKTI